MNKLLHDLGGIVLSGLPTSFLILILAFFVKRIYLTPMESVLAKRRKLTEGAREEAESGRRSADSKVAAYETALEKARGEIYAEQAEFLRTLNAEQAERARAAKATSDSTLATVRQSLAQEAAAAKQGLAEQSRQLATEIANSALARRAA